MSEEGGSSSRPRSGDSDDVADLEDVAWVQCEKPHCYKWRRISPEAAERLDGDDPWFCDMNPDPALRSCDEPEEDYSSTVSRLQSLDYQLVTTALDEGTVVWAKMPGYCKWPALVSADPEEGVCWWAEDEYHVEFLGGKHLHGWVKDSSVELYKHDGAQQQPAKPCKQFKKAVRGKHLKGAMKEAVRWMKLPPEERLGRCTYKYSPKDGNKDAEAENMDVDSETAPTTKKTCKVEQSITVVKMSPVHEPFEPEPLDTPSQTTKEVEEKQEKAPSSITVPVPFDCPNFVLASTTEPKCAIKAELETGTGTCSANPNDRSTGSELGRLDLERLTDDTDINSGPRECVQSPAVLPPPRKTLNSAVSQATSSRGISGVSGKLVGGRKCEVRLRRVSCVTAPSSVSALPVQSHLGEHLDKDSHPAEPPPSRSGVVDSLCVSSSDELDRSSPRQTITLLELPPMEEGASDLRHLFSYIANKTCTDLGQVLQAGSPRKESPRSSPAKSQHLSRQASPERHAKETERMQRENRNPVQSPDSDSDVEVVQIFPAAGSESVVISATDKESGVGPGCIIRIPFSNKACSSEGDRGCKHSNCTACQQQRSSSPAGLGHTHSDKSYGGVDKNIPTSHGPVGVSLSDNVDSVATERRIRKRDCGGAKCPRGKKMSVKGTNESAKSADKQPLSKSPRIVDVCEAKNSSRRESKAAHVATRKRLDISASPKKRPHGKNVIFECHVCQERLRNAMSLRSHMSSHSS